MRHKPWSNRRITVFTLILTVLAIVLTLLLSLSNHCYTPRQTVHAVEQQALLHPTALAAKGAFPSLQDSSDNDRGWQLWENDDVVLFLRFNTTTILPLPLSPLECSYYIVPKTPGQPVCVDACSLPGENLFCVFGCIEGSDVQQIAVTVLLCDEGRGGSQEQTCTVSLDTASMTLHDGDYYFAAESSFISKTEWRWPSASPVQTTLTLRDVSTQRFPIDTSDTDIGVAP